MWNLEGLSQEEIRFKEKQLRVSIMVYYKYYQINYEVGKPTTYNYKYFIKQIMCKENLQFCQKKINIHNKKDNCLHQFIDL